MNLIALAGSVRCFTVEIGKRSRNLLAPRSSRELYQQIVDGWVS
ncbi:MAG TPA: hypothetical protein V6D16_03935 [Candidatus Obscuribacterales bacterium]